MSDGSGWRNSVKEADSRREDRVDQARVVDDRFDIRQCLVKLAGFDGLEGRGSSWRAM